MTENFKPLAQGIGFGLVGDKMVFDDEVHVSRPGKRLVSAMSPLLMNLPGEAEDAVLYDTFADVWDIRHESTVLGGKLGYSLTSIRSQPAGGESAKTHGHVHSGAPDGFPPAEAYEVLQGKGTFMMMDLYAGYESRLAVAVHADVGDVVVIPGGLYHCSINAGEGRLVFADLCRRGMKDVYEDVRQAKGFAYLRSDKGEFVPNPAYKSVPPELKQYTAAEWAGRTFGSLYQTLITNPGELAWLWDREEFIRMFPHLREHAFPVGLATATASA